MRKPAPPAKTRAPSRRTGGRRKGVRISPEDLVRAALSVVASEPGNLTDTSVAAEAGVHRSLLRYYFPSGYPALTRAMAELVLVNSAQSLAEIAPGPGLIRAAFAHALKIGRATPGVGAIVASELGSNAFVCLRYTNLLVASLQVIAPSASNRALAAQVLFTALAGAYAGGAWPFWLADSAEWPATTLKRVKVGAQTYPALAGWIVPGPWKIRGTRHADDIWEKLAHGFADRIIKQIEKV